MYPIEKVNGGGNFFELPPFYYCDNPPFVIASGAVGVARQFLFFAKKLLYKSIISNFGSLREGAVGIAD